MVPWYKSNVNDVVFIVTYRTQTNTSVTLERILRTQYTLENPNNKGQGRIGR